MRTVIWSDTAIDQYDSAIDYLAERNVDASIRLAVRIHATIEALTIRPIGRPGEREDTYEKIVVGTSYLLVYGLHGGKDGELRIHRLFHMAQDWQGWNFRSDDEPQ